MFFWIDLLAASAATAAKLLQSCPTLCDPRDGSLLGFLCPWDSPGKNTAVGCHFLLQCMKVKSAQSCLTLRDPMECSPPGSSIHGTLQARVLEWGAIAFSLHKSNQFLLTFSSPVATDEFSKFAALLSAAL